MKTMKSFEKAKNRAIHEFLLERKELQAIPIGDEMSIAIVGFQG